MHLGKKAIMRVAAAVFAGLLMGGVTVGVSAAQTAPHYTIVALALPQGSGPISDNENRYIRQLTQEYEKAHPNVTVDWEPTTTACAPCNTQLTVQASHGDAPDIVIENDPELPGLPAGVIQPLNKWLAQPNPYIPGNKEWQDAFNSVTIEGSRATNGNIYNLGGADVEVGIFYNLALFKEAGITAAPTTWAEWVNDMKLLKAHSISPLLLADGGSSVSCDPTWFEQEVETQMLEPDLATLNVDHNVSFLDTKGLVLGLKNGDFSMTNPRYAESYHLLQSLFPYLNASSINYDACAVPSAATPPLNPESLLIQGKVAMEFGGSWWVAQLYQAGFKGKFGVFNFPTITKATTPFAEAGGVPATGNVGGASGLTMAITSQRADSSMTPAKTAVVVNFLEWLFTPKGDSLMVAGEGAGNIPTMLGATAGNVPGLTDLIPNFPTGKKPLTVTLSVVGGVDVPIVASADRTWQAFQGGSLTFAQFSTQWQALLNQEETDLSKTLGKSTP